MLRRKVLGTTNTYVYTVNFYDEKGRVIQTQSINNHGGVDITTTQYTWAGQPLVVVQKIEMLGADAEDVFRVITKMNYDDLGRLEEAKKRIEGTYHMDDISKAEQTIVKNEYDAIGQLKTKKLGANDIETLTYDYNIRGWMLGANRDYAKDLPTNNYFGFDLGYDKANNGIIGNQTYTNPQYNGNIEGMVWKSKGDGEKRKYDFTYDNANRLLKGVFTQYTNSAFNKDAGINYDMQMGDGSLLPDGSIDYTKAYDANGNIKSMTQFGFQLGGSINTPIDNLTYNYRINSNKLAKVSDVPTATNGKLGDFKDGTNGATDDYDYDINGNLNFDENKTIGGITYNHLNLPSTITVTGKGTITYTYDAGGNKLKKVTVENPTTANGNKTITTTTNYVSGFVYESKTISPPDANNPDYTDKFQFFGHEEGRIRYKPAVLSTTGTILTPASLEYDYMLKDHLGNVRMVLTEEQDIAKYPAATLETVTYNGGTALSVESQFYTIDNSKVVAKPSGIADYYNHNGIYNNNKYSNTAAVSENVYKIDGINNRTGLGITLKVMAGDKIDIFGKSYYKTPNGGYSAPTQPALSVLDILNTLAATPVIASKGGITGTQLQSGFPTNILSMFPNQPGQTPTTPKAFINWIVLDEQFKYVSGGFDQIGASDVVKPHNIPQISIPKNGYIYVYCSNETEGLVFFDNLQLMHTKGAILEETHYYPFGLTMAGISSKAANITPNKEKTFQGQQIDNDLELNWVQFKWRNHDPQIGRFVEIDPLSEDYVYNSTYAFSENKVTNHIELEGLEAVSAGNPMGYLAEGFRQWLQAGGRLLDNLNPFKNREYEVHNNLENKTSVSLNLASGEKIESSYTQTLAEKSATLQIGSLEETFKSGKPPAQLKTINATYTKTEQKNAISKAIRGIPIEISQKTTETNDSKSISGGIKVNTDDLLGNAKVEAGFDIIYKQNTSGAKVGEKSLGLKISADATIVIKTIKVINTPILKVNETLQSKIGGSFFGTFGFKF